MTGRKVLDKLGVLTTKTVRIFDTEGTQKPLSIMVDESRDGAPGSKAPYASGFAGRSETVQMHPSRQEWIRCIETFAVLPVQAAQIAPHLRTGL